MRAKGAGANGSDGRPGTPSSGEHGGCGEAVTLTDSLIRVAWTVPEALDGLNGAVGASQKLDECLVDEVRIFKVK